MIYSLPEQIAGVSGAVTIEPAREAQAGRYVRIEADLIGSMEVVIR
jgi:hypothetical protein